MNSDMQAALLDCLRLLRNSDHTRFELEKRLGQKHEETVLTQALDYLQENKFLNESRVLASTIERNQGKRAVGDVLLRDKLEKRGFPPDLIEQVFATQLDDELQRARAVVQAKFAKDEKRAKVARYLWSRGFREETIESVLEDYSEPVTDDV